jgi:hypothetical protein
MGMLITISEVSDFDKNAKGQPTHVVTELLALEGSDKGNLFLNNISDLCDMENSSTRSVTTTDFVEGLNQLKETLETIDISQAKKGYEIALYIYFNKLDDIMQKYGIDNKETLERYESLLTPEQRAQKDRIPKEELDELQETNRVFTRAVRELSNIETLQNLIADLEQFLEDNDISTNLDELDDYRSFDVYMSY